MSSNVQTLSVISVDRARKTSTVKKIQACAAWNREMAVTAKNSKDRNADALADRLNMQAKALETVAAQM